MFIVFGIGIYRELSGSLPTLDVNQPGAVEVGQAQGLLSFAAIFILLRAFANGGSSLTGLEAISDGVSLFKEPEHVNARRTLVIMSTLLGSLVLGVSYFAHRIYAMPYESGTPTVISQIAKVILGDGAIGNAFFIVVQAATMLILFAGANTTFSAFPLLVNFVATDGYLPSWLTKRGHKLNFSNGIILLTSVAMILVLITQASVEHLVAYYALGVFTAFTLSGLGMAKHASTHRDKGWKFKYVINGLSGLISLLVVIIFAIVKFNQGAWVVVVITPFLVAAFLRLRNQYTQEQNALNVNIQGSRATSMTRHDVTVLVDNFDLATIGAVRYARSLKPRNLSAVHFVIDDRKAEALSQEWAKSEACADVPLELIDCPDRRLANSAVDYAIRATSENDVELTLLLPRRSYSKILGWLLHDQTAEDIARPISQLDRVVATIVPFDVEKIISGQANLVAPEVAQSSKKAAVEATPIRAQSTFTKVSNLTDDKKSEKVSHYAENLMPIGKITWRKRAHVEGRVTSIKAAASGASPVVSVEIWDESGGVTLQFLGRREISGLEVGSQMRAEGMVGEDNGNLIILNPSYEIVI
jgi:hypothetical protein